MYMRRKEATLLSTDIYQRHTRMRLSTLSVTFIPTLLRAFPVMSSFHPPSGSLNLSSKTVTSSDGLQLFTESAGKEGAPAGKSPSLSPDSANRFLMQHCTVIFLHGLACTSAAFDPLFKDPNLTSSLFMVSRTSFLFNWIGDDPFGVQIRYDTRGHGRTGGPDNPEGYVSKRNVTSLQMSSGGMELKEGFIVYADDFAAVAAAYGVKKPFFAGW